MVKAFFSVNTQFENVGDALINRELIREVARRAELHLEVGRCPDSFVSSLSVAENKSIQLHRGFFIFYLKVILSRILGYRVVYLLNPGGLGHVLSLKQRAQAFIYTVLLWLLRALGVEVMHVGMSYEPVSGVDRALIRFRSLACRWLFPRDQDSSDYLTSMGVDVAGVAPDLAFLLPVESPKGKYGHSIIVSFRMDGDYRVHAGEIEKYVVSVLSENRFSKVLFLAQVERDVAGMKSLYLKCKDEIEGEFDFSVCSYDIEAAFEAYANYEYCISNRLHALLMATSKGVVPVVCLPEGTGRKIVGVFSGFERSNIITIPTPFSLNGLIASDFDREFLLAGRRLRESVFERVFHED